MGQRIRKWWRSFFTPDREKAVDDAVASMISTTRSNSDNTVKFNVSETVEIITRFEAQMKVKLQNKRTELEEDLNTLDQFLESKNESNQ